MRKKIHPAQSAEFFHLDLTSLLDVVFILLFFFLFTASFRQVETQVNVDLPSLSGEAKNPGPSIKILSVVVKNNRYYLGEELVTLPAIKKILQERRSQADFTVEVRGDRKTSYQSVLELIDLCRSMHIKGLSLVGEKSNVLE